MGIRIYKTEGKVLLEYTPENGVEWIDKLFKEEKEFRLKRIFYFSEKDLLLDNNMSQDYSKTFIIGEKDGDYYNIYKKILNTKFDIMLHDTIIISSKIFIINNNMSILARFEELADQQIIIGGSVDNSVPKEAFNLIIDSFPTATEKKHYLDSRVTNILSQYLEGVKDSGKAFEKYLEKHNKIKSINSLLSLNDYEYEKYTFILYRLKEMLKNSYSYSEKDWQNQILDIILILYPKYIRCFSNVKIKDYRSNLIKATDRFLDLMLVDTNGCIDIIEIKKPFPNCVISSTKYRDNHTPLKELTGSVMQVEKYLYYLNKWGHFGEKTLSEKYKDNLPLDLNLSITSPKGIIILGRVDNLNDNQKFDFEIIKKKYANVLDIMTYDDLLKRLECILTRFK